MRLSFGNVMALVVVTAALPVSAATLLHDDFSNGLNRWAIARTGAITAFDTSSRDSTFAITNRSAESFITRDSIDSFGDSSLTYSVTMRPDSGNCTNCGIGFCMRGITGYYFTIDSMRNFTLFKFFGLPNAPLTRTILAFFPSSHVHAGANRLTVSKTGQEIRLFCNGRFLYKVNDVQFSGGNIGMIVAAGSKVSFDDLEVANDPLAPEPAQCFVDSFSSGSLDEWSTAFMLAGGSDSSAGGRMKIATGSIPAQSVVMTSGAFSGFSMKAVVRTTDTSADSGLYGLTFVNVYTLDTSYRYKRLSFVINALGGHAIMAPDTTGFQITYPDSPSVIHGIGAWDTIEVLRRDTFCVFIVNGVALDSCSARPAIQWNGAGLMVDSNASIECAYFAVTLGDSGCPVRAPIRGPLTGGRMAGVAPGFLIFDPLGRRMADARVFGRRALPPGFSLIVHDGTVAHGILRLR